MDDMLLVEGLFVLKIVWCERAAIQGGFDMLLMDKSFDEGRPSAFYMQLGVRSAQIFRQILPIRTP